MRGGRTASGLLYRLPMVLAALMTLAGNGQEPSFRTQSNLVLVPVTVTNRRAKFVDGLEAADFRVLDNGKPREIATLDEFGTGVAPISLVVAVQSSGAAAAALAKIRKTGSLVQPLLSGASGSAAVLSFDDKVRWLCDFTSDADRIGQAFETLAPGAPREARMLDAVSSAVAKLERRHNQRRVLLIVSESRDRGSETKLEDAVRAVQRAGVQVYAATYSVYSTPFTAKPGDVVPSSGGLDLIGAVGELGRLGKTNTAQALAAATGGRLFGFLRQRALEQAIQTLGEELHSQYVLGFVPSGGSPGYHRLTVQVLRPQSLLVRARPGYWEQ